MSNSSWGFAPYESGHHDPALLTTITGLIENQTTWQQRWFNEMSYLNFTEPKHSEVFIRQDFQNVPTSCLIDRVDPV